MNEIRFKVLTSGWGSEQNEYYVVTSNASVFVHVLMLLVFNVSHGHFRIYQISITQSTEVHKRQARDTHMTTTKLQ